MTVSQSHAIELNDMHGKPKAQHVYAEKMPWTNPDEEEPKETPISSVEYFYKTKDSKSLDNEIKVIDKDGTVTTTIAGVNVDMTIDERESKRHSYSLDVPANIDLSVPFVPIALPSTWPRPKIEKVRFRSIANTKVITRYGVLEKVVASDLGSYVATENLAWDKETGEVLLTKTKNDFEDPVYAFTYPAHWGYNEMGQAYKNIGAEVELNGGTIANPERYFVPGDEVILIDDNIKAWVSELTPGSSGGITLVDRDGNALNPSQTAVVVRSGRRNLQKPLCKWRKRKLSSTSFLCFSDRQKSVF